MLIELSYSNISQAAGKLAKIINQNYSNRDILTFTRGGAFSAAFISNYLNYKPNIISLDPNGDYHKILEFVNLKNFIVLDDVLDSAATMKKLDAFLEKIEGIPILPKFFLVNKKGPHRIYEPKNCFSGVIFESSGWIKFPWEIDN